MIEILKNTSLLNKQALSNHNIKAIAHCTNCCNVFGAGIAKEIKKEFPSAFDEDTKVYKHSLKNNAYLAKAILCTRPLQHAPNPMLLGTVSYTSRLPINNVTVFNLYGQLDYGTQERALNYEAFASAFSAALNTFALMLFGDDKIANIAVPFGIGCGLAGGDWDVVYAILKSELKNSFFKGNLFICQL